MSIFILICAIILLIVLLIIYQGDTKVEFIIKDRTPFVLNKLEKDQAIFSCDIPFENNTSQDGTIMDAFSRHLLPQEQFDGVKVESRLYNAIDPREDAYWEAYIVYSNTTGTAVLSVTLTAKNGDIRSTMESMVNMPIDLYLQEIGRSDWRIKKARVVMLSQEIRQALDKVHTEEAV